MDTTYARMKMMKQDVFKITKPEPPRQPTPTLVKFNGPVLIGGSFVRKDAKVRDIHIGKGERLHIDSEPVPPDPKSRAPPGCLESNITHQQADEIFDKIIPPREWLFEGRIWRQTVSTTPAGKNEVIALSEKLKERMKKRGGKKTGICAVRRELYSQCFDEIVRQVTVNCTERGLVLLRVRDESNHVLSEYKKLFLSSVGFGLKKRLVARTKRKELKKRIKEVRLDYDISQRKASILEEKFESLTIKYEQEEISDVKTHFEDEQALRQKIENLKVLLEETINPSGIVKKKEEKVIGGGPNAAQIERLRLRALRREAEAKAKAEAEAIARAEAGLPPLEPPPVEGAVPVEGQPPGEGQAPAEGEPQAEGEAPAEGQAQADAQPQEDGQPQDPNQTQPENADMQAPPQGYPQPYSSPPQGYGAAPPQGYPQPYSSPPQGYSAPPQGYSAPPQGYSAPPQGYSAPPQGYSAPPQGYSAPPQGFSAPPQGYSAPPQGYSAPPQGYSAPPQGYSAPPQGYSAPPQGYSAPPQGYSAPPQGYSAPPQGYSAPPQGYPAPPQGYSAPPQGYSAPPQGYSAPPQGYSAPPQGYSAPPEGYSAPPQG